MAFRRKKKKTKVVFFLLVGTLTKHVLISLAGFVGSKLLEGIGKKYLVEKGKDIAIDTSIDKWGIRTILSQFIFFLRKRFHAHKNASRA